MTSSSAFAAGLRGLSIQSTYDSRSADLGADFFVPLLGASISYDRMTPTFTSSSLRSVARGLSSLIRAEGRMRLLLETHLSTEDRLALASNPQDRDHRNDIFDRALERGFEKEEYLATQIELLHVEALAWMVDRDFLEIRVAITSPLDNPNSPETIPYRLGIMRDQAGDSVSFTGQMNEFAKGHGRLPERLILERSWMPTENSNHAFHRESFNTIWHHKEDSNFVVHEVSQSVKERLTRTIRSSFAWDTFEKLDDLSLTENPTPALRDYQSAAINDWRKAGHIGILSMATGSGKTFVAANAIAAVLKDRSAQVAVVLVPNQSIEAQWSRALVGVGLSPVSLSTFGSSWSKAFAAASSDTRLGLRDTLVVVSVMNRAGTEKFLREIRKNHVAGIKQMVVADEAHRFGSPKIRDALIDEYEFRLGLSATPTRYFDDEGTDFLYGYFNGPEPSFEFSIQQALDWVPDQNQNPILSPFRYSAVFCELEEDEIEEYLELTGKLFRRSKEVGDSARTDADRRKILTKRAAILKTARLKIPAFEEEVRKRLPLKNAIVFCESEEQMRDAVEVLMRMEVRPAPFTMSRSAIADAKFGGGSERDNLIQSFSKGGIDVLVTMSMLDEGIDIPEATVGFVLASSGNPKEFIQRTGRIIRWHKDKVEAEIVDFLVSPPLGAGRGSAGLLDYEKAIVRKEISRLEEYSRPASNALEVANSIAWLRSLVVDRLDWGSSE